MRRRERLVSGMCGAEQGHKERLNGDGRCNKKSEYMKRSGEKNTHIQSTFGAIHI